MCCTCRPGTRSPKGPPGSKRSEASREAVRNSRSYLVSFAASCGDPDDAVLLKVRIVVESGDFPRPDLQNARHQLTVIGLAETPENGNEGRQNTLHRLDCVVDAAEINRLAKREVLGIEEAGSAVWINAIA